MSTLAHKFGFFFLFRWQSRSRKVIMWKYSSGFVQSHWLIDVSATTEIVSEGRFVGQLGSCRNCTNHELDKKKKNAKLNSDNRLAIFLFPFRVYHDGRKRPRHRNLTLGADLSLSFCERQTKTWSVLNSSAIS